MNNPIRTCVICKEKKEKKELFRLAKSKEDKYLFDEKQKSQSRAIYLCKTHECISRFSKNKRYKFEMEDLVKMVSLLKKEKKDYLGILKAMRNSEHITFGINMVIEDLEHIHFIILAEDISEKNDKKLVNKAKEKDIPFIHFGSKKILGDIFGKDEINVIAIKNKKIARGLLE